MSKAIPDRWHVLRREILALCVPMADPILMKIDVISWNRVGTWSFMGRKDCVARFRIDDIGPARESHRELRHVLFGTHIDVTSSEPLIVVLPWANLTLEIADTLSK